MAEHTVKVRGDCGHTYEVTFHSAADLATDLFQCPICNKLGKLEKILSVTVPAKLTIPADPDIIQEG